MRLTKEQEKAVSSINGNIIVNAGAGTGKTEVLTRRYLKIITEKLYADSLPVESAVAITFTVKAANEMKERIREMVLKDGDIDRKLIQDIENSTITTIHSFFAGILRDYSYYAKIDPLFTVMEEKESEEMLGQIAQEVLKELQKEMEADKSSLLLELVGELSIYYFSDLLKEIMDFYKEFKIYPLTLKELKDRTIENLESYDDLLNRVELRYELTELKTNINKGAKIYKFLSEKNQEKILLGEEAMEEGFLVEIRELLEGSKVKDREHIDEILKILDGYFLSKEKEKRPLYEILFDKILIEIEERYKDKKTKAGVLDFSDLEHLVYQLTKEKSIIDQLQEKYRYYMIDEYQDINDIQKEIFYRLTTKKKKLDCRNLFVVGDPKQSIYGFRGANIFVFQETREDILESGGEEIIFKDNFRSDQNLLDPINKIYEKRMPGRFHPLKAHRNKEEISLFTMAAGKDFSKTDEGEIMGSVIENRVYQKKNTYGDYSFLFLRRSLQKEILPALKERKIPYYIMKSPGFFDTGEIYDITNFLKYLYNQKDNVSFTGVLNSLFYNISLGEVHELLKMRQGLRHNASKNALAAFENLEENREKFLKTAEEGMYPLLIDILTEYEIFEKLNRDYSDYQRQGNLYKLLRLAREADKRYETLETFIEEIVQGKGEDLQMQVEDENSPVVKIMTIHESKGLGFSEIFVPGLNSKIMENQNKIKLDRNFGIAMNLKEANTRYKIIGKQEKEKQLIESDNLYYVAMTRAKENLYLGLSGNNSGYKKLIQESIDKLILEKQAATVEAFERKEVLEEKSVVQEEQEYPLMNIPYEKELSLNTLSITMVMDYLKNGLEHMIKAEENLEEEEFELKMPSFLKGQIIHSFAEKYETDLDGDLLLDQILEDYNINKDQRDLFAVYKDNFIDSLERDSIYDKIQREYPFAIEIQNRKFRGVIDRIEIGRDYCRIIDYKLSRQKRESLLKSYKLQMIFYGYVCEKLFRKNIILEIHNLENKEKISFPYNQKEKDRMLEQIERFIKEIEKRAKGGA